MHDARRYRYNAAECLLAAQDEAAPYCRKIRLSMAASWLSLAQQDELKHHAPRITAFGCAL